MGLLTRTQLIPRPVEVKPYPWAQSYARIEIDVLHDEEHDTDDMHILSVISECITQISHPSEPQANAAIPTRQKYGRVHFRVKTASLDVALEDLKQYLIATRDYLRDSPSLAFRVRMPFKCRRDSDSPALLAMRWREGPRNKLCLSPMAIEIPNIDNYNIFLDLYEKESDEGAAVAAKYVDFKGDCYGTRTTQVSVNSGST